MLAALRPCWSACGRCLHQIRDFVPKFTLATRYASTMYTFALCLCEVVARLVGLLTRAEACELW